MYRTVRAAATIGCMLFALGCNSTRMTPGVQPDSNPLTKTHSGPETTRPLPILQEIKHGTGDVIPAHPVFEPPAAKKIWRVGHRLNDTVWIGGYWMVVMYDRGRFAPKEAGQAKIPLAPRFEELPKKPEPKPEKSTKRKTVPGREPEQKMPDNPAQGSPEPIVPEASDATRAIAEKLRRMQLGGN